MSKKLDEYTKDELLAYIAKLNKDTKFGLVWNPKQENIVAECETKVPVLQEVTDKAIAKAGDDEPTHLLLEGDNYHSLSVLNYTHAGKVDVIYIDPPYNTGNKDFIYNDHYVDKDDPYRHSEWLSFMDNRLRLAKDLLSETGIVFMSIDDNEQAHLRILSDTIFGEENFIANIAVYSNPRGRQSSQDIADTHEYVLIYRKTNKASIYGERLTEDQTKEYTKIDDGGKYREIGLRLRGGRATAEESPTLHFPLFFNIKTNTLSTEKKAGNEWVEIIPKFTDGTLGTWRWSKVKINKDMHLLRVRKVNGTDGQRYDVFQKDYLHDEKRRKVKSLWNEKEINYDRASAELKAIFGSKSFDYAKPLYLLRKIIGMATTDKGIVLDFFAGTGTTGHAVLQLNALDSGKRQFILGTNNENGIAENITYERINKAINGYGQTSGIPANLRYFKTDFVEVQGLSRLTDDDKLEITKEMGAMIALRENSFKQKEQTSHWQTYENATQLTAIYYREDKTKIDKYIAKLNSQDKPVKLYVFGWGKNAGTEYASKKISVEDIPEPLIEVYKEIAK